MNLTNKKIESHKIQHRNSSCLLTRSHPPSPAREPQSAATIKIQSPESGYCQGYSNRDGPWQAQSSWTEEAFNNKILKYFSGTLSVAALTILLIYN